MTDTVLLTIDGPRATITLNDPAKHNRLNTEGLGKLRAAIEEADADPNVRVTVLTGAGESPTYPIIRKIGFADLKDAAAKGVDDFCAMPTHPDHTSAAAGKASSSSGQDRTVLGWSRTVPARSAGTAGPGTVTGPVPARPGPW